MRFRSLIAGLGLLALLPACAHVPTPKTEPSTMRAMTFNIRLDTGADGANAWPYRKDLVS